MYLPKGIFYDSSTHSIVIANEGANNVVRWVIGASNWTLLAGSSTGAFGSTSMLLTSPRDVTFDSMGNMYVADSGNHRIQFFLAGQMNATTIAGISGTRGSADDELNGPFSVTIDSQLNLYVSDYYNQRIQQFVRY
ncbi:unnamed protein product [Rotaria sp. Silwood1]|nr:unnamed protein product [Rotaria sp. Silwood1]